MTTKTPTTNPIPATWLRPDVPDVDRTVDELCREWHLMEAKMNYDLACLPDTVDSTENDRVVDAACNRQAEIEALLADSELQTIDDLQGVLRIVMKSLKEGGSVVEDNDRAMLRAVSHGLEGFRQRLDRKAA